MKQTELKNLQDSFKYQDDILMDNKLFKIFSLSKTDVIIGLTHPEYTFTIDGFKDFCKIVKRPLSDLTKEIEHNGEKFVPLHKLLEASNFNIEIMPDEDILTFEDQFKYLDFLNYNDAQMMLEWHFDIFGLIEAGLAIDINTLEK